jgi:hypothetical protein
LWSQKVLAACYESARTGRTVVLQPPGSGNFTGRPVS